MKSKLIPRLGTIRDGLTVRDGLVVVTVVFLLGVVFAYRASLQDRDHRLVAASDHLLRLQVVDRLVGLALPPLYLTASDGESVEFGAMATDGGSWVLAPEECAGCLDDIGGWNQASAHHGTNVSLILTGVSLEEGRRLVSLAGVRIPWAVDEDNVIRRTLGLPMPSTHLAVAGDRTIVMADTGSETLRCRSGFPSLVKYVAGKSLAVTSPTNAKGGSSK